MHTCQCFGYCTLWASRGKLLSFEKCQDLKCASASTLAVLWHSFEQLSKFFLRRKQSSSNTAIIHPATRIRSGTKICTTLKQKLYTLVGYLIYQSIYLITFTFRSVPGELASICVASLALCPCHCIGNNACGQQSVKG